MKRIFAAGTLSIAAMSAHLNPVQHSVFAAGLPHPVFGLDLILAMVAAGLLATVTGGRAIRASPANFAGAMMAGSPGLVALD